MKRNDLVTVLARRCLRYGTILNVGKKHCAVRYQVLGVWRKANVAFDYIFPGRPAVDVQGKRGHLNMPIAQLIDYHIREMELSGKAIPGH